MWSLSLLAAQVSCVLRRPGLVSLQTTQEAVSTRNILETWPEDDVLIDSVWGAEECFQSKIFS